MIVFSQNSNFERTISISQLNDELRNAAVNGEDYTLNNALIRYDSIIDFKYKLNVHNDDKSDVSPTELLLKENNKWSYYSHRAENFYLIEGVEFSEGSSVTFSNCRISQENLLKGNTCNVLFFANCKFSLLEFSSDSIYYSQTLHLSSTNVDELILNNIISDIRNSNINYLNLIGTLDENDIHDSYSYRDRIRVNENNINTIRSQKVRSIEIINNNILNASVIGPTSYLEITNNNFHTKRRAFDKIYQKSISEFEIKSLHSGLNIRGDFEDIRLKSNNYFDLISNNSKTYILNELSEKFKLVYSKVALDEFKFNKIRDREDQLNSLISYMNEKDSVEINFLDVHPSVYISGSTNNLVIQDDSLDNITLKNLEIKESLEITNLDIRNFVSIEGIVFPNPNHVVIDSSFINIGFRQDHTLYFGTENYEEVSLIVKDEAFISSMNSIIVQYRDLIRIFATRGSDLLGDVTYKMKSVLTTKKQYDYYLNPSIENWFNWKGNLFLKWYSDYGQNPFKALSYCFWTMIYFAGFYFFFYSDWDKINKQFLMSKFDSLILYFSSNKKLEDIYFKNDKTITESYVDFQTSIEENKTFLPSFVILLAKPLYKFSLIRIYVRKRLFNSAEILSERTWLELSKNKRVLFGFVTLMIIFLYIIYLILVRGFNSLILSINAFSTLGFGQIPVNGFTKYVAIIEGFVGWFFLSIFLVSLLNQMINI